MPVIEIKEVSKLYGFGDAATVALDEVSLSIEQGEFVAIMGPSGSGKTTLMNIIGLLDHPTHGDYLLNSRIVSRLKQRRRARLRRDTIGFVFQGFNLLPRLTVLENVALPLAYKGMTKIRRLKKAVAMLERVGLADREYFMPRHISGGQAQRVAIARALINDPNIIIADEPTGNLDSASSRLVLELLSDIHKAGNTVLLVTHNPALTRYASRVVFMQDGSIVADEHSAVGEMPESLRRSMYFMPKKTVKDDLEGVSALMKTIPSDKPSAKAAAKKKKTPKKRKYTARAKKGAKK
jgi:putative ABC transport system ATP-binding protein